MDNLGINTYGFDLRKVIEEAKENGKLELANEFERNISNLQACFDVLAERHSSAAGTALWNIDVDYLKSKLN